MTAVLLAGTLIGAAIFYLFCDDDVDLDVDLDD